MLLPLSCFPRYKNTGKTRKGQSKTHRSAHTFLPCSPINKLCSYADVLAPMGVHSVKPITNSSMFEQKKHLILLVCQTVLYTVAVAPPCHRSTRLVAKLTDATHHYERVGLHSTRLGHDPNLASEASILLNTRSFHGIIKLSGPQLSHCKWRMFICLKPSSKYSLSQAWPRTGI